MLRSMQATIQAILLQKVIKRHDKSSTSTGSIEIPVKKGVEAQNCERLNLNSRSRRRIGEKTEMKIPCDICGNVEAEVLCSADEAVLRWGCDERVHTANKLSQKHQRVPLLMHPPSTFSSQLPPCDICQDKRAYFFCHEDRALLCKNCDVSTHSTSSIVSSHRRFVVSGIKVALQSVTNDYRSGYHSRTYPLSMPNSNNFSVNFALNRDKQPQQPEMTTEVASTSSDMVGILSGETSSATGPEWALDEILGDNDFDYYEFSDMGQSRISS